MLSGEWASAKQPRELLVDRGHRQRARRDKSMDAFWMWVAARWAAFSTWSDQPATNGLVLTAAALMIVLLIMQRS